MCELAACNAWTSSTEGEGVVYSRLRVFVEILPLTVNLGNFGVQVCEAKSMESSQAPH